MSSRNAPPGALRDETNNGCVGDYWSVRQVEKSLFISLLDCCISSCRLSSTCNFRTVFTLLLLTMTPMFIADNSSFSLRLSEPERTFIFGSNSSKWQKSSKFEAKTENLTLLCTLIKHALSTNQSTRYIETFLSGRMWIWENLARNFNGICKEFA